MFTYRQEIHIPTGATIVSADLVIPGNANAIVVFAHAGADSRLNRLNTAVAEQLQAAGIGTLMPDLLSEKEFHSLELDIPLITTRLIAVTKWLRDRDLFGHYQLGYYATSTGAASALQAAAELNDTIGAIVCRGGRPDLAREALPEIQSPVLLIVGSLDRYVLQLNREAFEAFSCEKKLSVVQGANHFFGEGKIFEVAALAVTWFEAHLEHVGRPLPQVQAG